MALPANPSATARLSIPVVGVGLALGVTFGVTNLYVGLRLGATFTLTLAVGVLSFGILQGLSRVLRAGGGSGIGEATLAQTIAGAAMSMPSSGLVHAIPAMAMAAATAQQPFELGFVGLFAWVTIVSLLGVLVAAVLRPLHVRDETLPFPSATASAQALRSMGKSEDRALVNSRTLGIAVAVAAVVRFTINKLVTGAIALPGSLGRQIVIPLKAWGVGLDPSLLALATGALLGPRLATSILVGVLVSVGIGGPRLLDSGAIRIWSPSTDPQATYAVFERASKAEHWLPTKTVDGVAGALAKWTIWPGAALISTAAVVAILWRVPSLVRAARRLTPRKETSVASHDSSRRRILIALVVIGSICAILAHSIFHIGLLVAVFSVVMSLFFSAIAARVYGETDTVPSGPLAKLTQLLVVSFVPGSVPTNLVAANITAGSAAHSAELMGDLKTGELIGVSPVRQLVAQIIGIVVGGASCVAVYRALFAKGRIFTPALPATAAKTWLATSELLAHGLSNLPAGAASASIAAAAFGVIAAILERALPAKTRWIVPSPVGMGLGMLLPSSTAITLFVGAIVAAGAKAAHPRMPNKLPLIIAAGLMVGESLVDVATTLLTN